MDTKANGKLARFGFRFGRSSTHTARTLMLQELTALLSYMDRPDVIRADYHRAIDDENCLGKRSSKTRRLTYQHLVSLYGLDPSITVFRALIFFWQRDIQGQPLLALLCAYSRDPILRISAAFIAEVPEGVQVSRTSMEALIDSCEPGRFSKATLQSTAQNINSTWTKTGHLSGPVSKVRSRAVATPATIAYALLLASLTGVRGKALFTTEYVKMLDCSFQQAIELSEDAARRGWIVFKRLGDVIEVNFPNLLNVREMEWLREQS